LCADSPAKLLESAAHAAVDDLVSGANHRTADQRLVDLDVYIHLTLEAGLEAFAQGTGFFIVHRPRGTDLDPDTLLGFAPVRLVLGGDFGHQLQAAVGDDHLQKVDERLVEMTFADVGDQLQQAIATHARVADEVVQLFGAGNLGGQLERVAPARHGVGRTRRLEGS